MALTWSRLRLVLVVGFFRAVNACANARAVSSGISVSARIWRASEDVIASASFVAESIAV